MLPLTEIGSFFGVMSIAKAPARKPLSAACAGTGKQISRSKRADQAIRLQEDIGGFSRVRRGLGGTWLGCPTRLPDRRAGGRFFSGEGLLYTFQVRGKGPAVLRRAWRPCCRPC